MPNRISHEVYDETIAILEGRKQPDEYTYYREEKCGQEFQLT